jgi:hypothetical protein
LNGTDILGWVLTGLKYVFLAALSLFMLYLIGLLKRSVD